MEVMMRPPWRIRSRRIWPGLAICAVGVIAVGAVVVTSVSTTTYHAACALGVVLLLLGTAVTVTGLVAEMRSDPER